VSNADTELVDFKPTILPIAAYDGKTWWRA
jgi:hypothetical protein